MSGKVAVFGKKNHSSISLFSFFALFFQTLKIMPNNNTLLTADDLGNLGASLTINDFIGQTDPFDFYKFTLTQNSDLNIVFKSSSALNVALIVDLNGNGVVDSGEVVTNGSTFFGDDVSLSPTLPRGTYFLRAEQRFSNSDNYELVLTQTSRPGNVNPDPGNTLNAAFDLGNLPETRPLKDYVGELDEIDFYKFTLTQNSDLTATLQGIPGASTTQFLVSVIADLNNNGVADSGETVVSGSVSSTGRTLSMPLPAGTYFTSVEQFLSNSVQYDVTLARTPNPSNVPTDPGDTLGTAFNLGNLSGTRVLNEYVGEQLDEIDFYKFTLTQTSDVTLQFVGTSPDTRGVRAALIADLNNNGFVDSGETIENAGGNNDNFSENLSAGTYFVRVSEFLDPSHYELRLTQTSDSPGTPNLPGTPDLTGDDLLRGTNGRDDLRGFAGNDRILGLGSKDRLLGDGGNDRLVGGSGNDVLQGGSGRDRLNGQGGNDKSKGGSGNDVLKGNAGRDRLDGQGGNDKLIGGADRDRLSGGAGNDRCDGGSGNDIIRMGGGRDRIVLRRGQGFDRVKDFQNNSDKIDLVGVRFGQITLQQQRNDVLIKIGSTNALLLENTNFQAINRGDFV